MSATMISIGRHCCGSLIASTPAIASSFRCQPSCATFGKAKCVFVTRRRTWSLTGNSTFPCSEAASTDTEDPSSLLLTRYDAILDAIIDVFGNDLLLEQFILASIGSSLDDG